MEEENKDIFFVEVEGPEEFRRNILESLKDIIESLQRFEKFKETRKDKINHINKLREIVKGTNELVSDLKMSLPETKIRAMKVSKPTEKKETVIGKKKIESGVTKVKPMTELQKLESELNEIDSKLESLR